MISLFVTYKTKLQKSIWPTPIWSFFIFISFVSFFNLRSGSSVTWTLTLGVFLWIRLCIAIRLLLTLILRHKGYILETRGKEKTTKTKIYTAILKSRVKNSIVISHKILETPKMMSITFFSKNYFQ
jgi:hypothetical protein